MESVDGRKLQNLGHVSVHNPDKISGLKNERDELTSVERLAPKQNIS
jgi:hypothetical protein